MQIWCSQNIKLQNWKLKQTQIELWLKRWTERNSSNEKTNEGMKE